MQEEQVIKEHTRKGNSQLSSRTQNNTNVDILTTGKLSLSNTDTSGEHFTFHFQTLKMCCYRFTVH
jgi:hypothetical protein